MPDLRLVPQSELDRLRAADADRDATLALLADACRLNALVAVKQAGSGHLGSTFSALDVVVHLLFAELDAAERGFDDPDRDVGVAVETAEAAESQEALARHHAEREQRRV